MCVCVSGGWGVVCQKAEAKRFSSKPLLKKYGHKKEGFLQREAEAGGFSTFHQIPIFAGKNRNPEGGISH